jgi:hypothetical protein
MKKLIYPRGVKKRLINGTLYAFRRVNGSWRCICTGSTEKDLRSWVLFSCPHPNIDTSAAD